MPRFIQEYLHWIAAGALILVLWGIHLFLVAPMAFLMGMPFPTGIQQVSRRDRDAVPWMFGVNGGATVLGSILAVACAIHTNFTTVLVLAACGYGLALLAFVRLMAKRAA